MLKIIKKDKKLKLKAIFKYVVLNFRFCLLQLNNILNVGNIWHSNIN